MVSPRPAATDRPRGTSFQERRFRLHLGEATGTHGHPRLTAQQPNSASEESESDVDEEALFIIKRANSEESGNLNEFSALKERIKI